MHKRMIMTAVLAVTVVAGGAFGQCGLNAGFTANNGQSGNMFDIVAQNPAGIEVLGFTVNLDPGVWDMEIYAVTGGGSAAGLETTPGAWTLIDTFTGINGAGFNLPTPLPSLTGGGGPNGGVVIATGAVQGFYVTANNGTGINYTTRNDLTAYTSILASNADLDYLPGTGVPYPFAGTFTVRAWNGVIHYTYPGQVNDWETNIDQASMDVNGELGGSCSGVVISESISACAPIVPVAGTMSFSSNNNPGGFYEIASSNAGTLPASLGGTTLTNGEIFNLDMTSTLTFLNGGAGLLLKPLPGSGFPGVVSSGFSVPFSVSTPLSYSIQGTATDATAPGGFHLTQATQYDVVSTPPPASVPGPSGDEGVATIGVTSAPTCWVTGYDFYGTTYTELFVTTNGRVMTGFDSSDFSPTVGEWLSGPPTLGVWTDLNQGIGGTITVSTPASGIVRVDYAGVPFFGDPGSSNTFGVQFDTNTNTVLLDGLTGLDIVNAPGSDVILGTTPGVAATDPGTTLFTVAGGATAAAVADTLYDLGTLGAMPASVNGVLAGITLVPTLVGTGTNYTWSGF